MTRSNFVTHLECAMTGQHHDAHTLHNLSREGYPLVVRYDLGALEHALNKSALAARESTLWRYHEMLPLRDPANRISLGEVITPLVGLPRVAASHGAQSILVKDEGRLPTGSFKARGIAVALSMAKELGVTRVAMPTNGNAGAALSAYAARAGIDCSVFCPSDTPTINIDETGLQGAHVYKVDGFINDCGRIVGQGKQSHGWFDFSTLKEPYRIEGKKTMGLELAEQGGWALPDVIFYPTGGGTGLIGMWKVFNELRDMGWLTGDLPRMVAVQADGCAPIVRAYESGARHAKVWENAHTVAAGIRVPAAIGDFMVLDAVRESGGFATAVSDEHIDDARTRAAAQDGLLLCPEGAATLAAFENALASGEVTRTDRVVLFNCATGLKYPLPAAGTPFKGLDNINT
ncbi:MAG: threonine synthase [Gammaproteobacteria bacterium]